MKISDVIIKKIVENKGHIGFASFVIDDAIKVNNVAIFKRLGIDGYRLVFPEKVFGENKIKIFFPITSESYFEIEKAIISSMNENK